MKVHYVRTAVPVPVPSWPGAREVAPLTTDFTVRITNDHSVKSEPHGLVVNVHGQQITIPWAQVRWAVQYEE